ncbi:glycosyltransferase family 4 protein [Poritiphilus flavus]|uniref:Glycosyltransferase n=1 Tax=Poritiphilus flavus TaxID=2697053 RepID=A0A6L9EAB5_9FLAO|nr:glycosyltransferase family 4 protein [Poritiphilus flavus]NAS11522.1 glycosyltransferase [Poritiphilus flavus]
MKNVLVVYHYIAHYRIPIFNLLSKSDNPRYTVLSGLKTDIKIKTADSELAKLPPSKGGINWKIIKNFWFLKYFLFQFPVLKLSLSRKYDTVIFIGVMYYITTWFGAIFAKLSGKKVIFWTHGFIREENNLKGFVRKQFYKLADEILVYGQWAKDILVSKGFDPARVNLIYNSLDYDHQLKIRNAFQDGVPLELFKDKELPVIGFIGRLTPQKKVNLLLELARKINAEENRVNLLIIGSGEEEDHLKELASDLGLTDNIIFYGACYDEEVLYKLIRSMKAIISPGEVGLTAIHALTYGVPVITHNKFNRQMPEFEAIIEDKTGDFFEYDNVDSLKEVVLKWMYEKKAGDTVKECYRVVDEYYNPYTQKEIFDAVV